MNEALDKHDELKTWKMNQDRIPRNIAMPSLHHCSRQVPAHLNHFGARYPPALSFSRLERLSVGTANLKKYLTVAIDE